MEEPIENTLEKRKEKLLSLFKGRFSNSWQYVILAAIIIFGFTIRLRNIGLLKDITNGQFIPSDLDALVILRYVNEIALNGMLPSVDVLRYYPLGFSSLSEFSLLSYFIFYLYKFWSFFNPAVTIAQADIYYPPIAFVITMIFFFLFVRKLFDYRIALIASAFLVTIPSFLHRTMLGFSDKEALALAFMFIAYYLYVSAWKAKRLRNGIILGTLSGIATGMTGLVWGGVNFIFLTIGLFALVEILLDKFRKNDFLAYSSWMVFAIATMNIFGEGRYPIIGTFINSFTSGLMIFVFFVGIVYYLIHDLDIFRIKERIHGKYPKGLVAFFFTVILALIFYVLFFGFSFIQNKIVDIYADMIAPFGKSRWALTVAESHQPYIRDWVNEFGLTYFWLFLLGAILLFYEAIKHFKKNRAKATILYSLFLFGFIFSRYSSSSTFNGVSSLSKVVYIGSLILFGSVIIWYYIYTYYKNKEAYQEILGIDKAYIFMLIFLALMIVAGRSAVRLMLILAPVTTILVAYILIRALDYAYKDLRDNMGKLGVYFVSTIFIYLVLTLLFKNIESGFLIFLTPIIGILGGYFLVKASDKNMITKIVIYAMILSLIVFPLNTFAKTSMSVASYSGPVYNQQWQVAMDWAKKNTLEDAVFAHWWDYGYLVQYGANRATLSDGGNSRGAINYWIGRHVLTGQSDIEALQLLKANNATHLLIISDEIGKYPAFSSIGSDVNYDRYSWINTFVLNPKIQEGRNGSILIYEGGTPLDDDFVYQGKLYPAGSSGIGAFLISVSGDSLDNLGNLDKEPEAVIVYEGNQARVPLSCLYVGGQKIEFDNKDALQGCFRIIPNIQDNNNVNGLGAGLYLSPDIKKSRFAELYLFNVQNENFKVVYDDSNNFPLAIYQGRLIGPLKIWEITYPKDLQVPEEFYGTQLPDPRVDQVRE